MGSKAHEYLHDRGTDRLLGDMGEVPDNGQSERTRRATEAIMGKQTSGQNYVWCSTHSTSPRKHAHPEPTTAPAFGVTLGHGEDDRIVNVVWKSGDMVAMVGINVATLRRMLAAAEAYKPGATL